MSAAAVPLARAPHRSFFLPASPFHYFRSLSLSSAVAAKEGRHDVLCAIHHFCAGCVS